MDGAAGVVDGAPGPMDVVICTCGTEWTRLALANYMQIPLADLATDVKLTRCRMCAMVRGAAVTDATGDPLDVDEFLRDALEQFADSVDAARKIRLRPKEAVILMGLSAAAANLGLNIRDNPKAPFIEQILLPNKRIVRRVGELLDEIARRPPGYKPAPRTRIKVPRPVDPTDPSTTHRT